MTRAARVVDVTVHPTFPRPRQAPLRLEESEARLRIVEPDPRGLECGRLRWTGLQEGTREVVVTLLATIAFGLGWAAVEAGQANSALARNGIPASSAADAGRDLGVGQAIGVGPAMQVVASTQAAIGDEKGYSRPRMERR